MRVVILGAAGFIGRKLASALATRGRVGDRPITELALADVVAPARVEGAVAQTLHTVDVTEPADLAGLFGPGADVVFHLAAVVSGQAEAEFEVGLAINLFGTIHVLEACRALGSRPRFVFSSSIAAYGGEAPAVLDDRVVLNPQTSYGAQKVIGELLVTDYARKGFVDGLALRLPTVTIRPGKPNKAASGFASSIFREPLQGDEAVCPVGREARMFVSSPRAVIANLIHAAEIDATEAGLNRAFALPGIDLSIGEMVDAMGRVAGPDPVARIRWEPDPAIARFVGGWPSDIRADKALRLGFRTDPDFDTVVRNFLEDDVRWD